MQKLFDYEPPVEPPVESVHTDKDIPVEAEPRLGGQNGKVLARLTAGRASNFELEEVSGSRRINSRVADVRRFLKTYRSKTIKTTAIDTKIGHYEYEIVDA